MVRRTLEIIAIIIISSSDSQSDMGKRMDTGKSSRAPRYKLTRFIFTLWRVFAGKNEELMSPSSEHVVALLA